VIIFNRSIFSLSNFLFTFLRPDRPFFLTGTFALVNFEEAERPGLFLTTPTRKDLKGGAELPLLTVC
jgi:hypothetical protein